MDLLELVKEDNRFGALHQALQAGEDLLVEELWNSPKALVAAIAQKATNKHVLILTGASQEEIKLFHDFEFFTDTPIVDFPAWETLPSENIPPSPDIVGERYKVLHQVLADQRPHIILTGLQACLQKLIPPQEFKKLYLDVRVGQPLGFDHLIARLLEMGYQRSHVASDKGEYAVRGGIVDVFPVSSPDPFRIEFWGDEVESIRIYDPIGQKSVRHEKQIEITPAKELELLSDSKILGTILDYLGPETLIVFDDVLAIEDRYANLMSMCGTANRSFCSIEQFLKQTEKHQKLFWPQQPIEELSELRILEKMATNFYSENAPLYQISFNLFNRDWIARRWQNPFIPIAQFCLPDLPETQEPTGNDIFFALGRVAKTDLRLEILCHTELEESSFLKRLSDAQIFLPKHAHIRLGYLSSGFVLPELKLMILPLTEINQRYKIRRQKQRSTYHHVSSEVYELAPGDIVVHLNNGIGKFIGLEKRPNHQGMMSEFFILEYADNSKLFVPLNQAHLVSKYVGTSEVIPKFHTLGGTKWKKTKEQTERAILSYASELLELYATRAIKGGFKYPEDSDDVRAFEEDFPFVETEDQLNAIKAIKEDMSSEKSMDRLVCGDVGYGKTEVAMRAAFKAVLDGKKQVAVLVPTTVLAMQHYDNFCERMSNFPVNIGVLSRFISSKKAKETLAGLANGSVDIVIGTHRMIGEDVHFKDLGLIIIDEEQRFGVKAKEHLKKIKAGVDCLTLSATPIPRTLYMSLIGARDLSIINTPPQDRLPITTMIADSNDLTLKNALMRELARDGQAFFIHNRVETIFEAANRIKKLLPQARVVVGHGQMNSDEIDTVFHAFKNGKADILVATSIVESGIDIPNANTILIDRADRFGLADLYQLRGRVGRWNRRAYAYFLVPNQRILNDISRKRLNALLDSSGYGGGMKIAMRDLEIRGTGDILGYEQSGHVSAIGVHLYLKLLQRTIRTLLGKIPSIVHDVKLEFPTIQAYLSEEYVEAVSLRMEIYQRLGEALTLEDVEQIWIELKDRFGLPPNPALWLYHLTRVRVYAALNGFVNLKQGKFSLSLERHKGKNVQTKTALIHKYKSPQDFEDKVMKAMKEFDKLSS